MSQESSQTQVEEWLHSDIRRFFQPKGGVKNSLAVVKKTQNRKRVITDSNSEDDSDVTLLKPTLKRNKKDVIKTNSAKKTAQRRKKVIDSDSDSDDIRIPSTPKQRKSLKDASEKESKKKIIGSRKKTVVISDSDSDDIQIGSTSKTNKKAIGSEKKDSKKNQLKEVKSEYFGLKNVDPADVFGSAPVRSLRPKKPPAVASVAADDELHFDSEFDAALLQLDSVDKSDAWNGSGSSDKTDRKENEDLMSKSNLLDGQRNLERDAKLSTDGKGKSKRGNLDKVKPEKNHKCSNTPPKKAKRRSTEDTVKSTKVVITSVEDNCCKFKTDLGSIKQSKTKDQKSIREKDKIKSTSDKHILPTKGGDKPGSNGVVLLKEGKVKTASPCKSKTEPPMKLQSSTDSILSPVGSLWVDKYRPTSLKQIIGQQGDKSNVKKLLAWLRNWHSNHSGKKKLVRPSPWAKDDTGGYFKAALLSGPPGVGKTTTAHLVSKELNFDTVEFNASDTRSKKLLHQEITELLNSKSLSPYFIGGGEGSDMTANHVLIMDEVDGMAGNEDRGGVQELIQLIKGSRVPIICMCNDRNHPKIRSLVNYCFDLRFQRPRLEQIKGAMMSVCFKENLKVSPETLMDIITNTNQDIRLILNHLSMLAAEDSNLPSNKKHIKLGPWDVLRKVFSEVDHKVMSMNDKMDLFFHDYSIAPLFVQENYLMVVPHSPDAKDKRKRMELFAKAACSLSTSDLVDKRIRSRNAWGLLPVQAVFSSVVPGEVLLGHVGGQIMFPSWLGKNSKRAKIDRLLQEVQVHSRLKVSGNKQAINMDYARPLRDAVIRPLMESGSDGVAEALVVLHTYNLLREDLDSLHEITAWPNSKDPMAKVESKVKAAFTRAYNKAPTMCPFSVSNVVKKKGAGNETALEEEGSDLEGDGDDEEDKKDEGIGYDAMITVKTKTAKKPNPSASTPKQNGGKKGKQARKT